MASKLVADLAVGDQIPTTRSVTSVTKTATQVIVGFDDGSQQTFDLAGNPAIEVADG